MVGFLPDDLENYISAHSESGGDVEKALRKETLDLGPSSGMMSGDSVGNFLKFIVKTNKCKRILEIGTFTGYSASSTGVQAMAYGLDAGVNYNRQFATSSRSNSIETAGDEMVNAGVIYVTSAGNDNQRLGLGLNDPHLNDYLTTLNGADTRSGIPGSDVSGTVPSGHRNWIHP